MKFLVFLGTIRDSSPPRPKRLGGRVARAVSAELSNQFPDHEVEIVDALDYPPEAIFKPHFAYAPGKAPELLDRLADRIESADGYVMVSPEYNHSMSPALANLLNHFGSSLYSYKPSVIATYSAGQWGGLRAAVGMRTFLSELGCLPVSAMIHVPKAQDVFTEEGTVTESEDAASWSEYFGRSLRQLIWWAQAASVQRDESDPHEVITDFIRDPSERNAP